MHPVLFSLFGHEIPSFGVMVALGFIAALILCTLRAKHYQLTADEAITWIPRLLLAGLAGAKLAFFIYFPSLLFNDPLLAITYPGGLVLYGGIIGGIGALAFWARQLKVSFWKLGDFLSIPMLAGLGFGRIGCFLSGCCYGSPCHLPWAVQYPAEHITHPQWVHPAPLYASLLAFTLMAILYWFEQKTPLKTGRLSAGFLMGYGVIRIVMEALRDDRITVIESIPLSASQWISVAGILVGVWLLRQHQNNNAPKQALPTV